jgi:ubiquinone/menaquinone biosynthesis C-methylase UbiE
MKNKNFILNKKYLNKKNFKVIKYDFRFIINYLKKNNIKLNNQKILDVGCGNGSFLCFLKKNYPNNLYHGLDMDSNLIDLNKKNKSLKDINFIKGSVKKNFSKKNYNLITFLGTLNIFKNQEFILKNLFSNLQSKSFLIFNCYLNKNNIDVEVNYKKYLIKKKYIKNGIYIRSYQSMRNFLLQMKLQIFSIIPNPYPYTIKKSSGMNIYTLKVKDKNLRSNDLNILYDQYLIVAKKK